MPLWEYMIRRAEADDWLVKGEPFVPWRKLHEGDVLNLMGEAGWELITILPGVPPQEPTAKTWYFKRQRQQVQA